MIFQDLIPLLFLAEKHEQDIITYFAVCGENTFFKDGII